MAKLAVATFTGARDGTSVGDMAELSKTYPFVEWGIIYPPNHSKQSPSYSWLTELVNAAEEIYDNPGGNQQIHLSAHITSVEWMKAIFTGKLPTKELIYVPDVFGRIQLNFGGLDYQKDIGITPSLSKAAYNRLTPQLSDEQHNELRRTRTFIYQCDGVNDKHLKDIQNYYNASTVIPLCDRSYGRGIKPDTWLKNQQSQKYSDRTDYAGYFNYVGYAGGLSPNNLEAELPLIAEAAGAASRDVSFWIDMQTGVHNEQGQFDLHLVERCCQIISNFKKQ